MRTSRRRFLVGAGALAGAAAVKPVIDALGTAHPTRTAPPATSRPVAPATFDHVVVVCMENRSFDHFLGWLPGADGRQEGLSYPDRRGVPRSTFRLSTFQGCGHPDPDHSYEGARTEYHGGACDGWLQVNDAYSIGYYTEADLPFTGRAARAWTVCDNYFAATLGPTFPNRLYLHAAQTDRTDDAATPTSVPTIWDRLADAGVPAGYYTTGLPFLLLWGLKYLPISHTMDDFRAAAVSGNLPAVSYVDPPILSDPPDGRSVDDHPHGDIRDGEAFLTSIYQMVTRSPAWPRAVLIITFDEWGGFFDHVAPGTASDTNPALTGRRGFRVPCLVISPWARRGVVAHGLYDHTSILKMIETRWGLSPLTPRTRPPTTWPTCSTSATRPTPVRRSGRSTARWPPPARPASSNRSGTGPEVHPAATPGRPASGNTCAMLTTRRQFIAGAGALAGAAALAPVTAALAKSPAGRALPAPGQAGFDHVVVLCMENRSFDHFVGWLPGANGLQAGLSYPDSAGVRHPTYRLSTFQGCGHPDPDHSYAGARVEYDNGACDGWLKVNDPFSIGYYTQADLAFTGRAAPAWTVCDNYFAATLGPTFPNRMYMHSAQTDRTANTAALTTLPTIWDRLAAAGVPAGYYFSDLPFLALWGVKYLPISHTLLDFRLAAAAGALPAVSYVDPSLGLELVDGISSDDHPHGDIRNGEAFLNSVYQAVTTGPAWSRTVLIITFDEWGGFFDHVAPTTAPDTNPALTGLRGFRVPSLVISPLARRGAVAHGVYDHTSILKLIEWRWGLAPLSPRDSAANNLAEVLDFSGPPSLAAPQWRVDPVPALPCLPAFLGTPQPLAASGALAQGAARDGWPVTLPH